MAAFKIGDEVCFSSKFLRSTGQIEKSQADRRGTVKTLSDVGRNQLVGIEWKDEPGVVKNALSTNLTLARNLGRELC